jgi:hypothetical protein
VNRERWISFPASTAEELALLDALGGTIAHRTVTVVGPDGRGRPLAAVFSVGVEAPFDGKADVGVKLVFEGAGPGAEDRFVMDPWELLDQFLREAQAEAERRRRASAAP